MNIHVFISLMVFIALTFLVVFLYFRNRSLQNKNAELLDDVQKGKELLQISEKKISNTSLAMTELQKKIRPESELERVRNKCAIEIENLEQVLKEKQIIAGRELASMNEKIHEYMEKTKIALDATQLSERKKELEAELHRLESEIHLSRDTNELSNLGFKRREFTYEDPKSYQKAIGDIEDRQAEMLKTGRATKCNKVWTIDGSQKKADAMIGKLLRLAIRAFNADCDVAIAKVKWNNLEKMESRIRKSEDTIEKSLEQWGIIIDDEYRDLKIRELYLTFEKAEVDQRVKEEQRELREQMREEEKARKEAEKRQQEAENKERELQRAYEKAKMEMQNAHEKDIDQYAMKIKELEIKLQQAGEERIRAVSMAQLTKNGHVYIVSNIGSFGHDIYKIGMTRRLDPMERVWELSDASVPFDFDVHGIIRCDDAPALEMKFHTLFAQKAVNLINNRKEFFKVNIKEIQDVLSKEGFDIQLTLLAEAKEYVESEELRKNGSFPLPQDKPRKRPSSRQAYAVEKNQ